MFCYLFLTEESSLGQALPPGFPAPFLFADGLSSVETLLTNIQVRSLFVQKNVRTDDFKGRFSANRLVTGRLLSGPVEGGGGERPRAGQTDPGGEKRAEDGALSRKRDERESGTTAHLRTTEQRSDRHIGSYYYYYYY